ncbi:MAG: group III truncated hemoglobin [Bacteroidetes bacterium]|nr:group III truncated hemoglobin [Bacteroidota bacterium]
MSERKDITSMEDIKLLVDSFYGKIRVDLLLGGIFNGVIKDRWPEHLEKMYRFWQTVLLGEHTYYGSPFPPHAQLPIEQHHFDTWLKLWHETIDEHFTGTKADEAKWRGDKMAVMFLSKIDYYRNNSATPLL